MNGFQRTLGASVIATTAFLASPAFAQAHAPIESPEVAADVLPRELREVGIDQQLGAELPLDLTFTAEDGSTVRLRDYFGRRPVVLTFVYFDCPLLCSQVLASLVRGLRPLGLDAGRDFNVIAVSIDPRDTPARAAEERNRYLTEYGRQVGARGFHFLTGSAGPIRALTAAAGFRYTQDPATGLFRHGAAVMIATADGRLSRYLPGIDFAPRDLQLSIVDASAGRVGSLADRLLLYCYQYDPASGRYGLFVMRLLRIGATAIVTALVLLIGGTMWREGRARQVAQP